MNETLIDINANVKRNTLRWTYYGLPLPIDLSKAIDRCVFCKMASIHPGEQVCGMHMMAVDRYARSRGLPECLNHD